MTVLRGGLLVDGTGAPPRPADVVIEGERIAAVEAPGTVSGDGEDLDGLVLAPGFIDCHTHYDAQVLWDPDLTPSSWHGVTTVVMGNCGFGIARPGRQGARPSPGRWRTSRACRWRRCSLASRGRSRPSPNTSTPWSEPGRS
jgi:N-acyl-D-aspartate/D-glutamate deacylase